MSASGLIMIGFWWVERWGSPTPLHRSDVYHCKNYTTLCCQVFGLFFCWGMVPFVSCQTSAQACWTSHSSHEKALDVDELLTTRHISCSFTQISSQPITWQELSALGRADVVKLNVRSSKQNCECERISPILQVKKLKDDKSQEL